MSRCHAAAVALSAEQLLEVGAEAPAEIALAAPPDRSEEVDRAYEVYCAAERAGAPPDADEFCARYPALRSSLGRLLNAHQFLQQNTHLLGGSTPPWPATGTAFLGFHLERLLGKGAFARVYLAAEPALDRQVALKVSAAALVEARTLGRLGADRHPHIVPVHAVATDETTGLSALCMPYLGSATLCDALSLYSAPQGPPRRATDLLEAARDQAGVIARRPAADDRARREGTFTAAVGRLAGQLLDALAFIHGRDIVHRDLKPSNILLTPDGDAMLLDFNLSTDTRQIEPRIGGTLAYASPEQIALLVDGSKDAAAIDARSDLFSFGVILYELLTGTHPFGTFEATQSDAEQCRHLRASQRTGAAPVRQINPAVEPVLARLVDQCLAADPAQRPASAAAALDLLRTPAPRLLRLARRPWVPLLGAALVHLSVLAAVFPLPEQGLSDLDRGHRAFARGLYEVALRHYDRAVEMNAEDDAARHARGLTHLKLAVRDRSHFGEAAVDLTRADNMRRKSRAGNELSADEQHALALEKARIGYARQGEGELVSAEFYYTEARRLGLKSAALCNNLGLLLRHNRKIEAAKYLDEAIKLNPKLGPAYHNRALLRLNQAQLTADPATKLRQLLAGIEDAEQALKAGPVTGELHRDVARLHALAARIDPLHVGAALRSLSDAVRLGADCQFGDTSWSVLRDTKSFADLQMGAGAVLPSARAALLIDPSAF